MVGRPVDLTVNKADGKPGKTILEMVNLNVLDTSGRALASKINLTVSAGEVVAVAGVQGNGQSELAEAIVGLTRAPNWFDQAFRQRVNRPLS